MLTEPDTNYLFPKYVRHLLLVVGGLVFYARYTIWLLGPVVFNGAPGTPVFSAWTAFAPVFSRRSRLFSRAAGKACAMGARPA